jgi:hypothetical protein
MNDRKKQNREIIENIIDRDQIESEKINLIEEFDKKYSEELKEYTFVDYDDFLLNVRKGGYIRYVNLNGELRWGGILIKVDNLETRDPLLNLMNTNKRIWQVKFSKNYIFYKKHKTYNDRLRDIFLSYIE